MKKTKYYLAWILAVAGVILVAADHIDAPPLWETTAGYRWIFTDLNPLKDLTTPFLWWIFKPMVLQTWPMEALTKTVLTEIKY